MSVDRCICRDILFSKLKESVDAIRAETAACGEDEMIERLCEREGCGIMCGLCRPYVKLMLRTGETQFAILTSEEWDRLEASDGTGAAHS